VIFSGCEDKKQAQQMPLQMVGGFKATKMNVPLYIEAPAKITGSLEIQVRTQVSGIIKSRTFSEGQHVKEGETLFKIDPETYQAALMRAQGSLSQAQSEVRRTSRDYERMKKLHSARAVSQKEHDDSLSAFERASANLKVAEGAVREAEINLNYTDVKAPISGMVRKEEKSVGNLVSPAGDAGLLTSMVQICPLHANFSISGSLWSKIARGSMLGMIKLAKLDTCRVEVYMSDGTKYPYDGKVIFVDNSEDNLTSSVSVKAEIPNGEEQHILLPGQFARIKLCGAEYSDAIVIPASALISTKMGYVVYIVKDDKTVEIRPVKAEIIDNNALVEKGLKEGEVVVSEGIIKARPGQKVNVILKNP
jgi:membrane fusion protein (multidrug efflux system)